MKSDTSSIRGKKFKKRIMSNNSSINRMENQVVSEGHGRPMTAANGQVGRLHKKKKSRRPFSTKPAHVGGDQKAGNEPIQEERKEEDDPFPIRPDGTEIQNPVEDRQSDAAGEKVSVRDSVDEGVLKSPEMNERKSVQDENKLLEMERI
mgnify:FL=1|jgi:hypothetical protein